MHLCGTICGMCDSFNTECGVFFVLFLLSFQQNNQPASQPSNQLTNHPVSQPSNPITNKPASHPNNQSNIQPTNQKTMTNKGSSQRCTTTKSCSTQVVVESGKTMGGVLDVGNQIQIPTTQNCDSTNGIYCIVCSKCNTLFVGSPSEKG